MTDEFRKLTNLFESAMGNDHKGAGERMLDVESTIENIRKELSKIRHEYMMKQDMYYDDLPDDVREKFDTLKQILSDYKHGNVSAYKDKIPQDLKVYIYAESLHEDEDEDRLQDELLYAAERGDLGKAKDAIEGGAKINSTPEYSPALFQSIVSGRPSVTEYLLSQGAKLGNKQLKNALDQAIRQDPERVIAVLKLDELKMSLN